MITFSDARNIMLTVLGTPLKTTGFENAKWYFVSPVQASLDDRIFALSKTGVVVHIFHHGSDAAQLTGMTPITDFQGGRPGENPVNTGNTPG